MNDKSIKTIFNKDKDEPTKIENGIKPKSNKK